MKINQTETTDKSQEGQLKVVREARNLLTAIDNFLTFDYQKLSEENQKAFRVEIKPLINKRI